MERFPFVASVLILVVLGSAPAVAQSLQLCAQQGLGLVVALPQDQDCGNLHGTWLPLVLGDDDWTGSGTGSMRTGDPADRVAVGDADPLARLHVAYDDADPDALIVERADGEQRPLQVTGDGNVVLGNETGASARLTVNAEPDREVMRARAGGTTAFFIGADGQVGVRSSQPRAALQVNAHSGEDPLRVRPFGSAQPEFVVTSAGNVGIGDPAPADRLVVTSSETGRAGLFRIDNPVNIAATVAATTNGRGSALFGNILNPESSGSAVHAVHSGNGLAGEFEGGVAVTQRIGIGTREPVARLHIEGNNDGTDVLVQDERFARMRMVATGPDEEVRLNVQARGSAGTRRAEIGTLSNHGMVLLTDGRVRVRLDASGAVCIGAC